jgi:hypothetical protein
MGREFERGAQSAQRSMRRMMSSVGHDMARFARAGVGIAGGIARGMGVNFDVSTLVGAAVSARSKASTIANTGFVEGEKGAAGVRQNPAAILAEARAAANAAAISTDTALDGLSRFVKKSSDLETGRAILADMAKFAKATGSDFVDVSDAAGDIAKKMGDIPDKANAVKGAMMILARQGKLGAIDMSDMAKNISTMVAPANQFAEGASKSIGELGVLLQITKGMSKGPAQAATSVSNFVADLTSKGGLKGLHGAGMKDEDIFADKGHTKLNNLETIMSKALALTHGDLTKISATFSNKRSGAVLKSFGDIYSNAEAKQKGSGAAAVSATFAKYGGAASQKDIDDALKRELDETASKAQRFQNNLELAADGLVTKLLPTFEKLAPQMLSLAGGLTKLVAWAAGNPGEAIVAALVASIGKAALGEALVRSLAGPKGGAAGGGMGTMGKMLTIAAAAVTIESVGELVINSLFKSKETQEDAARDDEFKLRNITQSEKNIGSGKGTAEDVNYLKKEASDLEQRIFRAGEVKGPGLGSIGQGFSRLITGEGGGMAGLFGERKDKGNIDALKAELAAMKAAITAGQSKVQQVRVTNMPQAGPTVDPAGRTPPGAAP